MVDTAYEFATRVGELFKRVHKPTKAKQSCFSCLSRQKSMALMVLCYFALQPLQFNISLLNLVLSSMKWSLPYPTRPKKDFQIKEAALHTGCPKRASDF